VLHLSSDIGPGIGNSLPLNLIKFAQVCSHGYVLIHLRWPFKFQFLNPLSKLEVYQIKLNLVVLLLSVSQLSKFVVILL
jgi:hypothetical protein